MTDSKKNEPNSDVTKDDLDKLDDDLHAIEMMYRTRCVQPPNGISNVVVREIDEDEK